MGEMCIFSAVAWNGEIGKGGVGFCLIDYNTSIICVGSFPMELSGRVEMEAKALNVVMEKIPKLNWRCSNIFISSKELWDLIHHNAKTMQWWSYNQIHETKLWLARLFNFQIDLIQHSSNKIVANLANQGIKVGHLSLYHQGMEKAKWIMRIVHQMCFSFLFFCVFLLLCFCVFFLSRSCFIWSSGSCSSFVLSLSVFSVYLGFFQ